MTVARGVLVLLVIWQGAVWLLAPPHFLLPAPLDVAETLIARRDFLAHHAALTLGEIGLGLIFGSLAGILTALVAAAVPGAAALVWPAVVVLQALPVFAIAPLLVLWFGFGLASKVVMAGLIIFFPVASNFADGLRRTEPEILEAAALSGAGRTRILISIRIPLALPALVSGLRIAAPLAPLGAVIGEWVGASGGLGFIMIQANARMQTDILFAALLILAVLTLALRFLVDELGGLLVPWAREG
ncbi:ABC transporter permease [Consotaella aegiceratis]|uniref:ABC transporter permease n=1 Tax=Consotaella aegiceratis TaxID=3097961 RepID=UPI002F42A2C6